MTTPVKQEKVDVPDIHTEEDIPPEESGGDIEVRMSSKEVLDYEKGSDCFNRCQGSSTP